MTAGGSSERNTGITAAAAAAAVSRKQTAGSPWTDQETAHLINAYEERWYSLKRGQLKAQQWEEVAAEVATRCGFAVPSKNGTQCRHKVEKLRKRYRSERLKPGRSSWAFFDRIDRMERGPNSAADVLPPPTSSEEEEEDFGEPHGNNTRSINGILREEAPWENLTISRNPRPRKRPVEEDDDNVDEDNEVEESEESGGGGGAGDGLADLAREIRRFGEGYARMEKRRMEMMREMEREWMEMEARKVEMVMEAQRCLVEAIAGSLSNKAKNSGDP
ncbi:hypothetical protein HPP92_016178 [Vanilla planifolia]|uniref:Myb-like domain-containing protein n=1 Tax=Vanilla planifolia TaxID=51239 RepID=A0A835UNS5_VANPL|nr:hypothetical protein HPP92_016779 [Vanilla planifolia]KAG0471632.1 hypothetical protein HPP92_016178 [Vanilla planifolia]